MPNQALISLSIASQGNGDVHFMTKSNPLCLKLFSSTFPCPGHWSSFQTHCWTSNIFLPISPSCCHQHSKSTKTNPLMPLHCLTPFCPPSPPPVPLTTLHLIPSNSKVIEVWGGVQSCLLRISLLSNASSYILICVFNSIQYILLFPSFRNDDFFLPKICCVQMMPWRAASCLSYGFVCS